MRSTLGKKIGEPWLGFNLPRSILTGKCPAITYRAVLDVSAT